MRTGDVYVQRPDGSTERLSPGGGAFMQAHVSPDGTRALFWGERSGPPRIWLADTRTGDVTSIGPQGARHPVWHPDGRIVFALEPAATDTVEQIFATNATGVPAPEARLQLCVMRDDGSDVVPLTDTSAQDQRPAVDPDARRVAFVSNRGGGIGIWTLDLDDGRLEPTGVLGYRPWWSLDGTTIFHIGFPEPGRRHQIHALRVGETASAPFDADDTGLTHGPFADPSGDRLLVHSDRSGRWQIHELPLDGSPMRSCTPDAFTDTPCAHATRAPDGTMTFDASMTAT
jgi:Tol biopolymer transport system component